MDAATGEIEKRFDLSENDAVPSTYPVALAVSKDGTRAFVALWNASEVVELDLKKGTVGRKLALLKPESAVAPGTHPCALEISPDGQDDVCGAGESGRCGGGECWGGTVFGEGILRYAAAAAELLWRGAGGAGGVAGWVAVVCGECDLGRDCGDGYDEADGEGGEGGHGRTDRVFADGVDADVDELYRRQTVCCYGEGQRDGAE